MSGTKKRSQSIKMKSWDALPKRRLDATGIVTRTFVASGIVDIQSAAKFLNQLPYGRNSSRTDPLIVMSERCGTCSTKHAILARLASENEIALDLTIGIYEMNGRNTPGVGPVLEASGLACVPEAHCYLRFRGDRIDITREIGVAAAEPISHFMHEEKITPDQVGSYKIELHQKFMRQWIARGGAGAKTNFDQVWKIREACIAALAQS